MSHFSSLTVLSLEQATTLPFLTQRLAREGMRVIRVEAPGRGDPNRYVGRKFLDEDGLASYFLPNNCGKQAITLNLGTDEGRTLLHRLVAELPVDIFATNNRPSSYARLGIDYATLSALRPGLIWLGITGFGPETDQAAYDPVLQARAGWMALTGEPDGPPLVFGLPMADLGAAEHAYGAVMKALYERAAAQPGQAAGRRIDISMLRSAAAWMTSPIMLTALGERVSRRGNTHQFFAPVSVYPTHDGFVYIAVGNDLQWEALTGLSGFGGLARETYRRNAGRISDARHLNDLLAALTRSWATADLLAACTRIGVPAAAVGSAEGLLGDPLLEPGYVRIRDSRSQTEVILPPLVEVGARDAGPLLFPPRLGEHNEAVFGSLQGMDAERLAGLRERGVI